MYKVESEEPYEKAAHFLETVLKMPLWGSTIETVMCKSCIDVPQFYEKRQGPDAGTEKEIIVATGDGKGVVMRKDQIEKKVVKKRPRKMRKKGERVKKEAEEKSERPGTKKMSTVIGVYTIAPHSRTAEHFLKRGKEETNRPHPCNKVVQATLEGKEPAFQCLKEEVIKRDPTKKKQGVALVDGEHKLRQLMKKYLPWFLIIIDIYHVMEYLWKGAHVFHREGSPEAASWMSDKLQKLLFGKVKDVIAECKSLLDTIAGEKREQLRRVLTYLENGKQGYIFNVRSKGPSVSEWILDKTMAITEKLIADRLQNFCPGIESLFKTSVYIIDVKMNKSRRTTEALRTMKTMTRKLFCKHNVGIPNFNFGMHNLPLCLHSSTFDGPKCSFIKFK